MNLFRRHRCCALCAEEYQSQPSAAEELAFTMERNTEARIENTRALENLANVVRTMTTPHTVPTHIQTSRGIVMNLPEQIESDQ